MRSLILTPALLTLAACGSAEDNNSGTTVTSTMSESNASAAPAQSNVKLPFDMPMMPDARYISGMLKFSKPTKRRGGEAFATIAVQGSPLDIVAFYKKAMADNGFTTETAKHNDDSTATLWGTRENGEKFSVSAISGGSKTKPGEASAALVATKPKSKE